ncbi:hypothetical protein BGZ82_000512 [Podila clonocystis]|nr:hypothetical protein BGZ82_000512 [Podila clonocystis]
MAVVLVPSHIYLESVHEVYRPNMLEKRQNIEIPPIGGGGSSTMSSSSAGPTTPTQVPPPVNNATTTANATTTVVASTSSSSSVISTPVNRSTTNSGARTNTTSSSTATPTEVPVPPSGGGVGIGAVLGIVGGLVAAIGAAIVAFKCVVSRKDRARRNKEIAATLAESFDRSGSDKYHELGDGAATPIPAGAKLSRQGSQQDGYYQKEQGGDYYNNQYVQERYGGPNRGYDETEMSVMGGQGGGQRPMSPYMGQATSGGGQYAGYNDYDYDYGGGNGGYNNSHGHQQGGYGYGQRY